MGKDETRQVDALIVGAGFGGIYQLYALLKLGLNAVVIDRASDVGGTWFWNRYPGAMSDTESYVYRYSWDLDDLKTYPWSRHYVRQPEVLEYLQHVVKKYDLRRHMSFNTELQSAVWDEKQCVWHITTDVGTQFVAKYLVTALGLLSRENYPNIPNINAFKGRKCHTASWTDDIDYKNKRVGLIGCGSTGIQVVTEIAKDVKSLHCFQRHPQYSVPSGDGPVSPEYRQQVNANYNEIMKQVRNSKFGFGFEESKVPFETVPEEEREAIFEKAWNRGGGFRFMSGGFSDIGTNKIANAAACDFIRRKIAQIVKDPEKARKLQPHDYYARRPLCDGGYYQQFNRDNVHIVDLMETPITTFSPNGIITSDGTEYELDLVIFATGFDAIDGNYTRLNIRGVDGQSLKSHWGAGPTSYLGVSVPNFPNMFMITGPQSPFCNIPPAIEVHVEFITEMIQKAEEQSISTGRVVIEATSEAEAEWKRVCDEEVEGSLFKETSSWIFGANVPGKVVATRFYFGGLRAFREELQKVTDNGYRGFKSLVAG